MKCFLCILFCLCTSWMVALTEGYGASVQTMLARSCHSGNLRDLFWVVKQSKENGIAFSAGELINGLEKVVSGGFDVLLLQFHHLCDFSHISEEQKRRLIEMAIEIGYPKTARTLHTLGFLLTGEQEMAVEELERAFKEDLMIFPPRPMNRKHSEAHGGEVNEDLFEREYRTGVAYIVHRLHKPDCDFRRLLENLGHRRRHMAGLGKIVAGIEYYGVPTCKPMYTYYAPIFIACQKMILDRYPLLPHTVEVELNGRKISLTRITDAHWIHPDGTYREEIMEYLSGLCSAMRSKNYSGEKARALARDLGTLVWWMSHAPPFLRGTPTVISMLVDAFCIFHHANSLKNKSDLNCQALVYDKADEFIDSYFYSLFQGY